MLVYKKEKQIIHGESDLFLFLLKKSPLPSELLRCFAAPAILTDIRNPLICLAANRYFLMSWAGVKETGVFMQA